MNYLEMENINLLKYNRHWRRGFRYPFPKKRALLGVLLKQLSKKQIVEIVGLRRTGKTVLLFQVINHLLNKNVDPFSIWYFTFDEEQASLENLFQEFVKQTRADLGKDKIYVFLDEIQKLGNFQSQLKVYYDLYPNLKFFISGSTSLFIKKKTQESLAGRVTSFFLPPLSFEEYLHFREKENLLEKPLAFGLEIEAEFETFLKSQFVESIGIEDPSERKEYFISIMKKIIFEDVPQIFSIENPEILWRVVQIIGQKPGMLISFQNLSREIGISNKTLSRYLFYLEEAFLVKKVFNFSRNLITSQKKLKKYYLASPSFSFAVADFIEKGTLVENFVISLKDYRFFWRDPYKHEVDFIDVRDRKIIPIEVKYKERVSKRELKNLAIFSRKFKIKKAVVLKKGFTEESVQIGDLAIQEGPVYFP